MVSRKTAATAIVLAIVGAGPASPLQRAPAGWKEEAALTRLLAPKHVPEGSYHAYVSPLGLEAAITQIRKDSALAAWPEAWQIEQQSPIDVFGQGGDYNRWNLARLYNGDPARVARGPRIEGGQTVEAWTLISPYPGAGLQRLEPGTLLIVLRLE